MSVLFASLIDLLRRRPAVTFAVGILLLFAGLNYALWQGRAASVRRHREARQQGEDMRHALTNYTKLKADLAAVDDAITLIDRGLLAERALEVNLGYFYQLENASRVHLRQLNQLGVTPAPEGNPYKVIPFALQASGSYGQTMQFLRQLETGPRLLRITSYSLGRGDPKTGAMLLDVTVDALGK